MRPLEPAMAGKLKRRRSVKGIDALILFQIKFFLKNKIGNPKEN